MNNLITNAFISLWSLSFFLQVDVMDHLFKDMRENPPLHKNQPPVAGAIFWEKSLFLRIKHTIIRFQTMEEMMTSEQGKAVSTFKCHFSPYDLCVLTMIFQWDENSVPYLKKNCIRACVWKKM